MNDGAIFLAAFPFLVCAGCCFLCCYIRQRREQQQEFLWATVSSSTIQPAPTAPPAETSYTYAILPTVPEEEEPANTV